MRAGSRQVIDVVAIVIKNAFRPANGRSIVWGRRRRVSMLYLGFGIRLLLFLQVTRDDIGAIFNKPALPISEGCSKVALDIEFAGEFLVGEQGHYNF